MITISLIVAVIGLVLFLLSNLSPRVHPDIKRIGEIVFFCGLLTWLMAVGSRSLS